MTFSEFVQKLPMTCFGSCGDYDEDENKMRKSQGWFVRELLTAATTQQTDLIFQKDNEYLSRIYSGGRYKLSTATAKFISTNFDKEKLEDTFFNAVPSEDAKTEMCKDFEEYIGIATTDNIATKLVDLFLAIIRSIVTGQEVKPYVVSNPSNFDSSNINKALREIVDVLASNPQAEKNIELQMKPVNVERKITKEPALKTDVCNNVSLYFNGIKEMLAQKDRTNSQFSTRLSKMIREAFEDYNTQFRYKEQIFNTLVQDIKTITRVSSETACRIFVSYFVQSCEVFNYENA